jgi:hypothetical protein
VVLVEAHNWSGKLIGASAAGSDVFTLLKVNGEWKITHKIFQWREF